MGRGKLGGSTQLVGGKAISSAMRAKRAKEIKAAKKHEKLVSEDKKRHKDKGNVILVKPKEEIE